MKSFGIISGLDSTGGVKLPDMLLGQCEIGVGDAVELHLQGDNIVMKKYPPACVFCGSEKDLREYMSKSFCGCCAAELKDYQKNIT